MTIYRNKYPSVKSPLQSYTLKPSDRLTIDKRIINGKLRKVEMLNDNIVRIYDDRGILIDDRSVKLGIKLPLPPLPPIEQKHDNVERPNDAKAKVYEEDDRQKTKKDMLPITEGPAEKALVPITKVTVKKDEIPLVELPSFDTVPTTEDVKTIPIMESGQKLESTIKLDELTEKIDKPKDSQEMTIPGISNLKTGDRVGNILNDKIDNIQIAKVDNKIDTKPSGPSKPSEPIQSSKIESNTLKAENQNKIKENKTQENKMQENKIKENKTQENKTQENKTQENKTQENKIAKENKNMAEDILEEYKREQWAKKRDFEKNMEDMIRTTAENKDQISGISHKIENVEGKLGQVEDKIKGEIDDVQQNIQNRFGTLQERLGSIKKPVSDSLGEICTGVDCIKEDIKNIKKIQETYGNTYSNNYDSLDKKIETKFFELTERLKKLEEPSFMCDNCGVDSIKPLSSFCPNCGAPIHAWNDPETGHPVSGWTPYWKRFSGQQVA